jgi:hypothetical protein
MSIATKALQTAQTKGEMWWVPEILRLLGTAARLSGTERKPYADELIAQALDLSRKQKSRYLEKRLLKLQERQNSV